MRQGRNIFFIVAFIFGVLILIKSVDYLFPDFNEGFLSDKAEIFYFYKYLLYVHMVFGPLALFAGLYQFSFIKSRIHRAVGRSYAYSILLLAAPAGFLMSFYALGGIYSIINFLLLAILWFYFTLKAVLAIKNGNKLSHKRFMIRSFILTCSAVILRLLSFVNNYFEILNPVEGYVIIAWLSWLPWLLLYEVYLMTNVIFKKPVLNSQPL